MMPDLNLKNSFARASSTFGKIAHTAAISGLLAAGVSMEAGLGSMLGFMSHSLLSGVPAVAATSTAGAFAMAAGGALCGGGALLAAGLSLMMVKDGYNCARRVWQAPVNSKNI
jgi:hypothetical protein